jgi:hypothetical protein
VVKLSEENQSQRKTSRASDPAKTELKLKYLETLRQMSFGKLMDRNGSEARIAKTCDSIEADLSI